jgi:endonuclease/exonuclease/phosphatase family metal-dependent hydrolase/cell division septation protein DedD
MRNDVVDPRVKVAPWIALIIAMLTMLSLPPSAEAASYSVPTGIKATSRTASTISLAWNTIPNAPRYRVRYATKANLSDSVYRRTYDPKYTLTSLKPNTTYYIQVRVISADGTTNLTPYSPTTTFTTTGSAATPTATPTVKPSPTPKPTTTPTTTVKPTATTTPTATVKPTATVTPTATPTSSAKPTQTNSPSPTAAVTPAAPTGVQLVGSARTALAVEWTPVKGATGYRVTYRKDGSGSSASTVTTNTTRADLLGLSSSTRYSIEVRAVGSSNSALSAPSKALVATTRSSTHSYLTLSPANIVVTPDPTAPANAIRFSWDSRGPEYSYRVKLSSSPNMSDPIHIRQAATSGSIADMSPGTSRYLQVVTINKSFDNVSEYSPVIKVTTSTSPGKSPTGPNPLRVASYNVTCYSCGNSKPNARPWAARKAVVAKVIKDQSPDVIGIQEASQGQVLDPATGKKSPQFEQLVKAIGGSYKITNDQRYNCEKSTSPNNCKYRDRGASQGTRIIYDSSRVKLISQGSTRLSEIRESDNDRYLAWAIFQQLSSGKQFFFGNTHLEPSSDASGKSDYYNLRKKQAQEILASIRKNNPKNLPIIMVGDLNSHRWTNPTNAPYEVFLAAGLVDHLGMALDTQYTQPGADVEHRINTWYSSYNGYAMTAPRLKYLNGTYLDYILTTPMRMTEYENVVSVNHDTSQFIPVIPGVDVPIPSDHNMQRATVHLP